MPEAPQVPEVPAVDLARSLATIHQICVTHQEDLHKQGQTKVQCHSQSTQVSPRISCVYLRNW